MKENYINLCFVIDESGSMEGSESDVLGGFNKMIKEQRKLEGGKCTISLFKFNDEVKECFVGLDVKDVKSLEYSPGGCTAMNDGIGIAIDRIGEWLSNMPEEERPAKNMIVVMTDGMENVSKKYTFKQVRNKIKHQEEKYSWTFVYMGTDITDASTAEDLCFSQSCFSDRGSLSENYDIVNDAAVAFRKSDKVMAEKNCFDTLNKRCKKATAMYESKIGRKILKNIFM